jgi:hypothetical protein
MLSVSKHFSRGPVLSPPPLVALLLSLALLAPLPVPAQQPTAESPAATRRLAPGGMRILVLEGQGVVNSVTSKSAISPVVQVLDSLDQPVPGATVTFEVSPVGPGGTFGTAPMTTVKTDFNGQATASFTPNAASGSFTIRVTANLAGQTATAAIRQTNDGKAVEAMASAPSRPWYKNWKLWAVIGAGAGAAAAIPAIRGGGTPTITLSPGPVVIGGPR